MKTTKTNIQLSQQDCLQLLKTLGDDSIDLIATDPPYFRVKKDDWDRQWPTADDFLHWLDGVLAELARVMSPLGSIYLFAGPHMATQVEQLISGHFSVLNHIFWRKPTSRHLAVRKTDLRRYFPQTESIIFAESLQRQPAPDYSAHYEPIRAYLDHARQTAGVTRAQINKACGNQMAGHWFSRSQWSLPSAKHYETINQLVGGQLKPYEAICAEYQALRRTFNITPERRAFNGNKERPHTNVWDFPVVNTYPGKHPCEKPTQLMEHIVLTSSNPGQTVLDPFAGSGTTAVACINTGRNFIGSEKGPDEYHQALERISKARANT